MWTVVVFVFIFMVNLESVQSHGFLAEPPARNSMWRFGFNAEKNYNDNGLNCGGYSNQWDNQGGKCGLCGDPWQGPRLHEAGGLYANVTRPITRCYNPSKTTIDVTTRITAYHKGYFEFRICPNNDKTTDPGQLCAESGRLLTVTGSGGKTRYDINQVKQDSYTFQLDIPEDIECTQCVLHWLYNTGNSWGCEPLQRGQEEPTCGFGLGPAEQFINCADIAILPDCSITTTVDPGVTVTTPEVTTWTGTPRTPPPVTTEDNSGGGGGSTLCPAKSFTPKTISCEAVGDFANVQGMVEWCQVNCYDDSMPLCPSHQCSCPGVSL